MLQSILALLALFLYYRYFWKKPNLNLPPGPKPLPIVGNIRDFPPNGKLEYEHWLELKDTYGPIMQVSVLGQSLILIHDRNMAHDLLEKSSTKTSGRPHLHFGGDLCGYGVLTNLMPYNATHKHHRKLIHRQLGTKTLAAQFQGVQDIESRRLLLRTLDDPNHLIDHIKTEASAIILQMTYGYSIEPHSADPLVLLIERMMHTFLPGMSFKKTAQEWNKVTQAVIETPYTFVRQQMANGTHRDSYVSSLITEHASDGENSTLDVNSENAIKRTAATMYAGGADTIVSTLSSFILAMLLFPNVQKKAQEEIYNVIGTNRLPRFEDRDSLPYVDALVRETHRWIPVAPLGLTHVVDDNISYAGFDIPKGAYLLPAVWWFCHDPQIYADPSSFDPARYLEPRNEPDPTTEIFGYGRRICPGRFLADQSLFITISRLLAVFDIKKATDNMGNEIEPKVAITPGLISRPLDFPYSVKPRSAGYVDLIKSVEVEHPWEESDASSLQAGFATA
ncbi:hypothetical protein FDECE_1734 [Fusarium decemcellulare]|nr:hypothetical protein FDECE_1734 [Fusarium decemcellulare]